MESKDFSDRTVDRWGDMRLRLLPILGDVELHLGPAWHRSLEELFTAEDLEVAAAVSCGPLVRRPWHLIRYAAAGQVLDECGEGIACAPSLAQATASLLEMCEKHRVMPTTVVYDEASSLKLYVRGNLLAAIEPVRVKAIDERLRQRALGTIVRLRKAQDPIDELLKRIQRWPGLSGVRHPNGLRKPVMPRADTRHLPIPSEWRLSAKLLCAACGRPEADARLVDQVTTAALDALNWNHLVRHGERSGTLLQPWVATHGDEFHLASQAFYQDGIDAFAETMSRLPREYAAGWLGITLEYGRAFLSAMPVFRFRNQAANTVSKERLLEASELPGDVTVYPAPLVDEPQPVTTARAKRALADGDAGIAQLFGTALPLQSKAQMLDSLAGQALIVQDASWRFTRTGDPAITGTMIWAYRLDENGNCAERVSVPSYKGLLLSHRSTGLHILSADYYGRHPVAAIQGLSPTAVAQIRACLPDTGHRRHELVEDYFNERDKKALQRLLDTVLPPSPREASPAA